MHTQRREALHGRLCKERKGKEGKMRLCRENTLNKEVIYPSGTRYDFYSLKFTSRRVKQLTRWGMRGGFTNPIQ